jgi:hypothetical protein
LTSAIASPLTLLRAADHADEVLALSYTFNAGFWERAALSLARSLQARVTVLSDASQASIDPRATRKAGIRYLDARAHCIHGGAFHPKLFVIASRKAATVAIGSGNATLSGWQSNAEIWTVIRGNQSEAPTTLTEIAYWLQRLPTYVALGAGAEHALNRTATLLASYATTFEGPRLATTLDTPILNDLPGGPVQELRITSPFLDRGAVAIERLIDHFQPQTTRIALDREAEYDGDALFSVVEKYNIELTEIDSRRYHHGKLIEWTIEDKSYGLTGSPNASRPALVLPIHEGGNCELGLVSPHAESIWPQTRPPSSPARMREKRFAATPTSPSTAVLLGATATPAGINLTLATPLTNPGAHLQIAQEDVWLTALPIPEASAEIDLDLHLPAGTHIRLQMPDGSVTNTVAVTDLGRVLQKMLPSTGRANTDERNVFTDPRIANALARDLADLRQHLDSAASERTATEREPSKAAQHFETVDEYLDKLTAKLGDSLVTYGLALPRLGSIGSTTEWTDHAPDPNDPEDQEADDDTSSQLPVTDLKNRPTEYRIRFRKWATQLVEKMPNMLPGGQLVIARLLVHSIAGGLWDTHDEPFGLLMSTVESISAAEAVFDEERSRLASMSALCLSIARRDVSLVSTGPNDVRYTAAVKAARPILGHADEDVIHTYSDDVAPVLGYRASADQVTQVAAALADPIDTAMLDATELGYGVRRSGRVIEVTSQEAHPDDVSMRILGRASECSPIAVLWSDGDESYSSVWDKPYLVIESSRRGEIRGELLKLTGLAAPTPQDLVHATRRGLNRYVTRRWTEREARPDRVEELYGKLNASRRPTS